MHACTHTPTHIRTHARTHPLTHTLTHTHIHTHTHTHTTSGIARINWLDGHDLTADLDCSAFLLENIDYFIPVTRQTKH